MEQNLGFKYFYGTEAESFTFYRIPKALMTEESFKVLTSDAKILYGLMLDRMSLSLKNGWFDEDGRVYIYGLYLTLYRKCPFFKIQIFTL